MLGSREENDWRGVEGDARGLEDRSMITARGKGYHEPRADRRLLASHTEGVFLGEVVGENWPGNSLVNRAN